MGSMFLGVFVAAAVLGSAQAPSTPKLEVDPFDLAAGPKLEAFEFAGRQVSREMQALWILYGPCRQSLEEAKLQRVIEKELARRAEDRANARAAERAASQPSLDAHERARLAAGFRVEELARLRAEWFAVEPAVDREVARTKADFKERAPELDASIEMRRSFRTEAAFRSQLRWAIVFDRAFLAADEAQRPATTLDALRARFGGEYERWKTPWKLADGSIDPQYQGVVRQIVRDHLYADEHFVTSFASPGGVDALVADDPQGPGTWSVPTVDLWRSIASSVDPAEVDSAREFWRTAVATRAALAKEGLALTPKELDDALGALRGQLQEFVPSLEAYAVQQQRFPSPESFFEFYSLICTYQKKHSAILAGSTLEKPAQALLDHVPRVNARHGGATFDAEVLLVSAWDFANARWKLGGRANARLRAEELLASLRENERALAAHEASAKEPAEQWRVLVDTQSDWWDPPATPGVPMDPTVRTKNKGRFGALDHSNLLEHLELSRYDLWVRGSALMDAILFDLAPGTIGGPYPHAYGWCLVRLVNRTPPTHPLDPRVEGQRGAIEVDFLDESFRRYSCTAVEAAERTTKPR
ncbi:MAG: hypothetical protein HZA53_07840 [Planctomycetes bacterium]|nr:hypothetical protein [Planctomycetota bacterium]